MRAHLAFAATFLLAGSLSAQSDMPKFAVTAATVANAIRSGEDLRARDDMPLLRDAEYQELAKLSGCSGAAQADEHVKLVMINWLCSEDSAQPGLSRSTLMLFDSEGTLYGFAINPVVDEFAPTEATHSAEKLPSRYQIAKAFAKAVAEGGDLTLDGTINIGEYEVSRLSHYIDGKARAANGPSAGNWRVFFERWEGDQRQAETTYIFFDEDGRPTGIIFAPTYASDWDSPNGPDLVDRTIEQDKNWSARRSALPRCPVC